MTTVLTASQRTDRRAKASRSGLKLAIQSAWNRFREAASCWETQLDADQQAVLFWALLTQPVGAPTHGLDLLTAVEPLVQSLEIDGAALQQALWGGVRPAAGWTPVSLGQAYERWQSSGNENGVFYTPHSIAAYQIAQTLGALLTQAHKDLNAAMARGETESAQAILARVQALRVIDPACGCGVFLSEALTGFASFYQAAAGFTGIQVPEAPARYALLHQLCGVDSDPMAVKLCQWGLWHQAARLDGQPFDWPTAGGLLIHGDALLAGTVPELSGGWNVVLGNPPYRVEVRGQGKRFNQLRQASAVAHWLQPKLDLCDLFLGRSLDLLAPEGLLGLVLPQYWTQRSASAHIRQALWERTTLQELWRFEGEAVFERAPGHHTSLLILKNKEPEGSDKRAVQLGTVTETHSPSAPWFTESLTPGVVQWDAHRRSLWVGTAEEVQLWETLTALPQRLLPGHCVQQGVVMPQGRFKQSDRARLPADWQANPETPGGLFLLTQEEVARLGLSAAELACLKPFYTAAGFRPWQGPLHPEPDYWLIYGDQAFKKLLQQDPTPFLRLKKHLDDLASLNTSDHAPYGLHRPRQVQWFDSPGRILGLRQTDRPCFAAVSQPMYVNESFLIIRPPDGSLTETGWVGLLNASLSGYWFYRQKRKGHRLQIDKEVLTSLPMPGRMMDSAWRQELDACSQALYVNPGEGNQEALDACVNAGYGLSADQSAWIARFRQDQEARLSGSMV